MKVLSSVIGVSTSKRFYEALQKQAPMFAKWVAKDGQLFVPSDDEEILKSQTRKAIATLKGLGWFGRLNHKLGLVMVREHDTWPIVVSIGKIVIEFSHLSPYVPGTDAVRAALEASGWVYKEVAETHDNSLGNIVHFQVSAREDQVAAKMEWAIRNSLLHIRSEPYTPEVAIDIVPKLRSGRVHPIGHFVSAGAAKWETIPLGSSTDVRGYIDNRWRWV